MAKHNERQVFFYRAKSVASHPSYTGLPGYSAAALLNAVDALRKLGYAERTYRKGNERIVLADSSVDTKSGVAILLLTLSDKNASDPVISDWNKKSSKRIVKTNHEGLDHSCHVVFSLKKNPKSDYYQLLIEATNGLAPARIELFIKQLLRLSGAITNSFQVNDPSGAKNSKGIIKKIRVRPSFEFRGYPSTEFLEDLKDGVLKELEIYTVKRRHQPWDGNAYTLEDRESVFIKPNSNKLIPKAKALIDSALAVGSSKNKYEEAMIRFVTANGQPKAVRVFTKDYSLVNDLKYVRKATLNNFQAKLPSSFDSINQEISQKIIALL